MISAAHHVNSCKKDRCNQCFYLNHRSALKGKFPWLTQSWHNKKWSAKCRVCGIHLSMNTLTRHARTKSHLAKSSGISLEAPSVEEFKKVLQHCMDTKVAPNINGIPDIGKGGKIRRMIMSLADGMKRLDHQFTEKVKSMSIMRDASKGKLCIRFAMVDKSLETRAGLLAWQPVINSSAQGLLVLTTKGMRRFATLCVGGVQPQLIKKILKQIRWYTHNVAVDAADNEVLASELMRRSLTPNLCLVTRDKAHGTRRMDCPCHRSPPSLQPE